MRDVPIYTVLVQYTYPLFRNNNIYVNLFHLTMFFIKHTSGTCVCNYYYYCWRCFIFLLSLSPSLLENNSRIQVLFIYRYSVHWSLILSGYIVVDHRRTVHFRQDITYIMFHIVWIINTTDHVRVYLRWNLKTSLILWSPYKLTTARRLYRDSRVIFEWWYWFAYVS